MTAETQSLDPESDEALAREQRRLNDFARALSKKTSWPDSSSNVEDVEEVEWIQTHISHVFLVGDRVFKLRKAVRLPFLDFSTCADRNADCLREVHLNRRLARSVYLGVAPVRDEGEATHIGEIRESIDEPSTEHVVVMRRLPLEKDALSMLMKGRLEAEHLVRLGNLLEGFHAQQSLGRPAPWSADAWQARIEGPVRDCFDALVIGDPELANRVEAIRARVNELMADLGSRFEARRVSGMAVDGHGDLHLDHVWFAEEGENPLVIDCIEFNEDLRRIDRASEVAFLAMDLRYRGRADLAETFLSAYASASDDYGLYGVVDFYCAYRGLVRAKVAVLATHQSSISPEQREAAHGSVERHLELAETFLCEPTESSGLILMCGTVGSGKSSVAQALAREGRGVPIASDRVRKALLGLSATTRTADDVDRGIYSREQTERVYAGLLERAGAVIDGGRTAILDASFSSRAHREAARKWARTRGLSVRLIEVRCDPEVAKARLAKRQSENFDPSDAGPEFLATSRDRFEEPDEWAPSDRETIWTS